MRLFKAELRRFVSRRAVVVLMLLGVLACGAIAAATLYSSRPLSEAERVQTQQMVDGANQTRFIQGRLAKCVEKTGDTPSCESKWLMSTNEMYIRPQLEPAEYQFWLIPMAGVVAAVSLLLGATFIGADFSSGSLGTQLLFEPSRLKVWSAKAAAVAVGVAGFAVLSLALANGTIFALAQSWDRPFRDGLAGDWFGAIGRAVVLAAVAGVGGYAVVVLARHTAAALGVLAVYGIAGEAVLRNVWPGSEKWLFSNSAFAWIGGDIKRRVYPSNCYENCRPQVFHFTQEFAATYIGLGLLVVAAISLLVFRRRDVT